MRKGMVIYKDGYTVKMKNRRMTIRKTRQGDWIYTFTSFNTGKIIKKHYDKIISRGNKHICVKWLRLSDEAMINLIDGYVHFFNSQNEYECKITFPNQ